MILTSQSQDLKTFNVETEPEVFFKMSLNVSIQSYKISTYLLCSLHAWYSAQYFI